jgi:glycine/D-amino acid oxidase-like deaminating enzyme
MEEVIVIGAGIIGASTAYHLTRLGYRPRLVDSAPPGNGCSFGNAGLIAVDHVAPLASPATLAGIPRMLIGGQSPLRVHKRSLPRMAPWMTAFVSQSRPAHFRRNTGALASVVTQAAGAWSRLLQQHVASDLYRDAGSLYVYEKPVSPDAERRQLDLLDRYGVQYANLSAQAVREQYLPTLTARISHARYFPGMASVTDPRRVVERIVAAASAAGATFTEAPVRAVRVLADARLGVRIGESEWIADKVVVCAGAASAGFTQTLGTKLPLTRERGYHVQLAEPSGDALRVPVSFVERGFTCNPMAAGIRLAGTVELGAGEAPDWRRADILASQFGELFPHGAPPRVESRWYGDRPTLPDYLPVIGELPAARNVFVATGHQHLGLTLGPLTGELVAQLVARQTPAVDLAPFRADRF